MLVANKQLLCLSGSSPRGKSERPFSPQVSFFLCTMQTAISPFETWEEERFLNAHSALAANMEYYKLMISPAWHICLMFIIMKNATDPTPIQPDADKWGLSSKHTKQSLMTVLICFYRMVKHPVMDGCQGLHSCLIS